MKLPEPAAVDRIVAIAARTASQSDGEALNAARLLNRELERAGLRIDEVLRRAFAPEPDGSLLHQRPLHQRIASEIQRATYPFSDRERDFLATVVTALTISDRQFAWLEGLAQRVAMRAAT